MKRRPKGPPRLACGDHVEVREQNIRPWTGEVTGMKLGATAWWAEVLRDDDGMTWGVVEDIIEVIPPTAVLTKGGTR